MRVNFRRTFVTGFLLITPVLVTWLVVKFVFGAINNTVTPLVFRLSSLFGAGPWDDQSWLKVTTPIVSVILAAAGIYLLGLIGGNVLGRQVLKILEGVLLRIPLVRSV